MYIKLGINLIFIFFTVFSFSQVGIGTTVPRAALDIRATNDGLLIPRVALTATNVATVITPTISELVYNTATSAVGVNQVVPGFYYWMGTRWLRLATSNQLTTYWGLNGSAATPTSFIGTTNDVNVVFKRNNGYAGSIGYDNIVLGQEAQSATSDAEQCVAIGYRALNANVSGLGNTAVGYSSLEKTTTGGVNTAVGSLSLGKNTTGYGNSAFGVVSLSSNTTGFQNVAVGGGVMTFNTIGNRNVAVGSASLRANVNGNSNCAFGHQSIYNASTASFNAAFGSSSMFNTNVGSNNVAMGSRAMFSNTSGSNNTAIGFNALVGNTTGNNNTAIGSGSIVPSGSNSNQVRIGNSVVTYAGIQVAWSITSDINWKTNIEKSNLGLDFINTLNPVSYFRKKEVHDLTIPKREYGFIAQELEQNLKDSNATDTAIITKDDQGLLSVRYNDLLAPMVKAMQEIEAKNKKQEEIIATLILRIETLEKNKK